MYKINKSTEIHRDNTLKHFHQLTARPKQGDCVIGDLRRLGHKNIRQMENSEARSFDCCVASLSLSLCGTRYTAIQKFVVRSVASVFSPRARVCLLSEIERLENF